MDRNVARKQQAMALSTWRQEELVLSQAPGSGVALEPALLKGGMLRTKELQDEQEYPALTLFSPRSIEGQIQSQFYRMLSTKSVL